MNIYEIEDYRQHKVPPKWLEWQPMSPFSYLITLLIFLFIIPWTLGFSFGPIGILFNCIINELFKNFIEKTILKLKRILRITKLNHPRIQKTYKKTFQLKKKYQTSNTPNNKKT